MALSKQTVIDRIEILEQGHLQVRRATHILEDGVRIGEPTYTRVAYAPGDRIPGGEAQTVSDVAALVWTPAVIDAQKARVAEMKRQISAITAR